MSAQRIRKELKLLEEESKSMPGCSAGPVGDDRLPRNACVTDQPQSRSESHAKPNARGSLRLGRCRIR